MSTHDSSSSLRPGPDAFLRPGPDAYAADEATPGAPPSAASIAGLLAAAQRLTTELAATQVAVQELTAEIARAALRAEAPTARPGDPAARDAADGAHDLPPRRGDHAVMSPAATESPARPAPAVAAAPPYVAPAPRVAPAPYVAPAPHVAPAPPVGAPLGEAPAPASQAAGPGVLRSTTPLPPERPVRQQAALQHQGQALERQPGMAELFDRPPAPSPGVITELSPSAGARPAHESSPGRPASPFAGSDHASSLADVPLLSAGSVDVLVGPVTSLADLDALQGRILELPGVEAATVTAFEGHDVLLSVDLDRPLPLASMLRTELGRGVASCRLVEGRIVVTFVHRGSAA
jgi:hypothetical protein